MIAVDTNILLRYVLADDTKQTARVTRLIDRDCAPDRPALLPNVVLAEAIWYISQRLKRPKPEIVEMLWALLDNLHLTFESRSAVEQAVQEYETGPADFADYLIGTTAAACGATPTFTFDRDAALRAPFALLET